MMRRADLLDIESGRAVRTFNAECELRAHDTDPDIVVWDGYASITDHAYPIGGGVWPGWQETIQHGAFRKTLRENADVAFLVNHGGMTLARTKSETLRLNEDKTGLRAVADLDRRVSLVNDLAIAAARGDIDEMSFAFRVVKDQWYDDAGELSDAMDGTQRTITEINLQKGDVSAVNYGANPATSGGIRHLELALTELRAGRVPGQETLAALRDLVDEPAPIPVSVSSGARAVNIARRQTVLAEAARAIAPLRTLVSP